ncbi:hypothetical protein CGRAC_0496 [Campylobacter gracilis]|nr:hypothetical protein CGRAC_0496 [Campylobacter gracilis]
MRRGILIVEFQLEIYAPNFDLKFYLELAWLESLQAKFIREILPQNFKREICKILKFTGF